MKKGSALLIVLGMLSFMVVSAVGFSIYMRTSRAPSSYLRRNIAARHLVKAALAKAIGELEGDYNADPNWGTIANQSGSGSSDRNPPVGFYGIYDDPFPGIVMDNAERNSQYGRDNGDYWLGRVFMPFGAVKNKDEETGKTRMETVSTLTLEALAYLPPAIIDDVRRLSRYTRTAIWRPLSYGVGRYAYCAVNVSDMFDINKLRANVARDSGMNRITLASLYMDSNVDLGGLDAVLNKGVDRNSGQRKPFNGVPFVSLADFNLVAANNGGINWAPFMNYVGSDGAYVLGWNEETEKSALFITDTWFPPSSANSAANAAVLDLSSNAQPFKNYTATCFMDIGSTAKGVLNTDSVGGVNVGDIYVKNLGVGIVCLYDYLDSDNRPSSLALPTTEAVPMIVGVSCPGAPGLEPTVETLDEQTVEIQGIEGTVFGMFKGEDGSSERREKSSSSITATRKCTRVGLKSLGADATVKVVVVSPFKRLAKTQRTGSYTIRGLMRVWLAEENMGCRPENDSVLYPKEEMWNMAKNNAAVVENGVATFFAPEVQLPNFGDVTKSESAVSDTAELKFTLGDVDMPVYYKIEESDPKPSQEDVKDGYDTVEISSIEGKTYKTAYKSFGNVFGDAKTLRPLKADGGVSGKWEELANGANTTFEPARPYAVAPAVAGVKELDTEKLPTYRLYAAVWVQVLDGGRVVDMAPACLKDDIEWLGADTSVQVGPAENLTGGGAPLLNFRCRVPIKYADMEADLAASKSTEMEWKALYAVDPRYNFASEDWFSSSAGNAATADEWKQAIGIDSSASTFLGQGGRDHDIFMFVSDQEYLQSIGELQFLPFVQDMNGRAASAISGDYAPNFHGESLSQRTSPTSGTFANGDRFWKTYTAYPVGGVVDTNFRNPYYMRDAAGNDIEIKSGSTGFKVNPFSQDDRVMDAALVGTPFDWYVASTNYNQKQSEGRPNGIVRNMTLEKMTGQYSFGDDNDVARLTDEDIDKIFNAFKTKFENEAVSGTPGEPADWLAAYNELNWSGSGKNDDNKIFLGATLSETLHGVDRKYLHSFWRECFDNRQQLFLIFVRAEPASVGGGATSRISSQLGGRAVALVWRDPEPPANAANVSRPPRSSFSSIQDFLTNRGNSQIPPHKTRVLFYHQFE